jgi:hypothetical protein
MIDRHDVEVTPKKWGVFSKAMPSRESLWDWCLWFKRRGFQAEIRPSRSKGKWVLWVEREWYVRREESL